MHSRSCNGGAGEHFIWVAKGSSAVDSQQMDLIGRRSSRCFECLHRTPFLVQRLKSWTLPTPARAGSHRVKLLRFQACTGTRECLSARGLLESQEVLLRARCLKKSKFFGRIPSWVPRSQLPKVHSWNLWLCG